MTRIRRALSTAAAAAAARLEPSLPPALLEVSAAAAEDVRSGDLWLQADAVTEAEAADLANEAQQKLKKLRYDRLGLDNVIVSYREVEKAEWAAGANAAVLDRLRALVVAFMGRPVRFLPPHVIDLSEDGYIKPHVDNVQFSGELIAGLSLLSATVMELVHTADRSRRVRMYLPPRSFYVQRGVFRFSYAHEILERSAATPTLFAGAVVPKGRRISIMLRDAHPSQ